MMNRREALAGLAGTLGYLVTGATLAGIAQSCKTDQPVAMSMKKPMFFTEEEMLVLTRMVDVILPKTDTPSASEVGAHRFIDQFALEVMNDKAKAQVKVAIAEVKAAALALKDKAGGIDFTTQQLEEGLTSELKKKKSPSGRLRSLTILAYKSSELVGTEVLAYLPVPGEFIPCGDLEELTGGKLWSL
jgi:hypothetical protein